NQLAMKPLCERTCLVVSGSNAEKSSFLIGAAFIPRDADGKVRRYCRKIQTVSTTESNKIQMMDSLPWIVAKTYNPALAKKEKIESNEVFLVFDTNDQDKIHCMSAGTLLEMFDNLSAQQASPDTEATGWNELVKNKIVYIGGTFKDSRDFHKTVAGDETAGVKIIAQAVETELEFGGIRIVDDVWSFFAQLLASVLFVYINVRYNRTAVPLIGVIAIPFAALVFSLVAFSTFALWANFIPVLVAVQLHALFSHIENIKRSNRELKAANIELKEKNIQLIQTKKELARAIDVGGQMERHRVSMRLHAETLMELFKLETKLDPLREAKDKEDIYNNIYDALRETRRNVRDVMDDLYPSSMKGGLAPALRNLAKQNSSSRLAVSLVDDRTSPSPLDSDDELRLYRIVQNALRNVIEHSQADQCEICLDERDGKLTLEVRDNGVGFQSLTGRPNSRGVLDIQELTELLNGTIEWITPSKKFERGTSIILTLPLASLRPTSVENTVSTSPSQAQVD
ncbi:MAG: CHASE2 domain-containing protein, partial [Cyanobacteria bacterium]|nr:CHASE2 domain-containing protein [Cyanobacteriota bacterium]